MIRGSAFIIGGVWVYDVHVVKYVGVIAFQISLARCSREGGAGFMRLRRSFSSSIGTTLSWSHSPIPSRSMPSIVDARPTLASLSACSRTLSSSGSFLAVIRSVSAVLFAGYPDKNARVARSAALLAFRDFTMYLIVFDILGDVFIAGSHVGNPLRGHRGLARG